MTSNNDVTKFRRQPCPYCGNSVDSAGAPTPEASRPPTSGDFFVCFGCTEPSIYQTGPFGAYLRKPTPAELAEFAVDYGHHAERLHRFINDRPDR
ncbi:hypothetical protein QRX50_35620 [Amycolatopsis carbonis]|uniref:Uncharacterized protein n=1 Tax=Amycolatopsis carbonis TaxID=715471 RepID=A0A9Y2IBA0_9PSEU|nr:hypothetical protein [Amycolatopsis sp. 2-15]WIX76739.1 hypothetical protein QRX50_35620 [Amycolatopsis sp. 2-15]